jgi:hypothetical protein
MAEALVPFLLSLIFSPAGFIGFCCGLSRAVPVILGGAIFATVLETILAFAIASSDVDPLYVLMTPIASLITSAIGWGVARLCFGSRNRPVESFDESTRLAYKHDMMEPVAEDY